MKRTFLLFLSASVLLFLSACGAFKLGPTATPAASPTPDLCSPANLPNAVAQVNNLMRQFDDYAALASNTPQAQLVQVIPPMQAIRRSAEDQAVPTCLVNLKRNQLLFMNITIQTLLAFQSNAKAETLNAGIAQARQAHDQYTIELARLLGLTVVAPPTSAQPSATAGAQVPSSSATPAPVTFTVVNPGPNPLNLHVSPSLTSQTIGSLSVGQTATAVAKSSTGEWVMIAMPGAGQNAWVYTSLVQFSSGSLTSLPVANP